MLRPGRRPVGPAAPRVLTASSRVPGLCHSPPLPLPGCALNDSPAGLAAYILEKFSTWTDSEFQELEDGGLER